MLAKNQLAESNSSISGEKSALSLIKEAFTLSSHILIQDPSQLAAQLSGRLGDHPDASIQRLLAGTRQRKEPWLRPLTASLAKPGQAINRTLLGHEGAVYALAVSGDSRRLFSAGSDKTIRIWDFELGAEMAAFRDLPSVPRALTLMPEGNRIVAGFVDGSIRIFDWRTQRLIATLTGHSDTVNSISCTQDGQYCVSASSDKNLVVWDMKKQKRHRVLKGHKGWVNSVCCTQDGKYCVSASDDHTLIVWDIRRGRKLGVLQSEWPQFSLAISPDGKTLVSGSDMVPILWELKSMQKMVILTGYSGPYHDNDVKAVEFSLDGRLIISGDGDHIIKVWNNKAEYPYRGSITTWATHQSGITDLAVTPNGRCVISSSYDGAIKIWNLDDLQSETRQRKSTALGDPVKWIGYRPDNKIISLTVRYQRGEFGEDSEWESNLTFPKNGLCWYSRARAVVQNQDRSILWVAIEGGIKVIDTQTGKVIRDSKRGTWWELVLSKDDSILAGYDGINKKIEVWDSLTETPILDIRNIEDIVTLLISADLEWLVAGNKQGEILYWQLLNKDLAAKTLDRSAKMNLIQAHQGELYGIEETIGRSVISYGEDGQVRFWDLQTGSHLLTIKLDWEGIKDLVVSADGLWLAAVSKKGEANIWNIATGNLCMEFSQGSLKVTEEWNTSLHSNPVVNLKFMSERGWVVVNNGVALTVWNLESGKKIAGFTGDSRFESFAVSHDESHITIGTVLGELHQLLIDP